MNETSILTDTQALAREVIAGRSLTSIKKAFGNKVAQAVRDEARRIEEQIWAEKQAAREQAEAARRATLTPEERAAEDAAREQADLEKEAWSENACRDEDERQAAEAEEEAEAERLAIEESDAFYAARRADIRRITEAADQLGLFHETAGFAVPGGSNYIHVYRDLPPRGEYLGTIRISDHPQPAGGGYSLESGDRHGEADLSIDPDSGHDLEDALSLLHKWAQENDARVTE